MDAELRRERILSTLSESEQPIVARKLAEMYKVSRQVIVGDIALLRAEGQEILSTPRGYTKRNEQPVLKKRIVCQHHYEQTQEELYTVVDYGGQIIDVIVEHPIYGELIGGLNISSRLEADDFLQEIQKNKTTMLADLTNGLHSHTISAKDEATIEKIIATLEHKKILYK
ncbi:transcription repressor NadR [Marinilactibacillus sp. Marseille-P9653]|uniref:transcription repressor NadR n=1 Tax=Marinilactibacillus sp. Marseille-P9653 TaxID=2866583 RepID=UPI001CE3EFD5|nr:transcription repressor NadR [Marinilactibacillus sp. Marseille-P9653]